MSNNCCEFSNVARLPIRVQNVAILGMVPDLGPKPYRPVVGLSLDFPVLPDVTLVTMENRVYVLRPNQSVIGPLVTRDGLLWAVHSHECKGEESSPSRILRLVSISGAIPCQIDLQVLLREEMIKMRPIQVDAAILGDLGRFRPDDISAECSFLSAGPGVGGMKTGPLVYQILDGRAGRGNAVTHLFGTGTGNAGLALYEASMMCNARVVFHLWRHAYYPLPEATSQFNIRRKWGMNFHEMGDKAKAEAQKEQGRWCGLGMESAQELSDHYWSGLMEGKHPIVCPQELLTGRVKAAVGSGTALLSIARAARDLTDCGLRMSAMTVGRRLLAGKVQELQEEAKELDVTSAAESYTTPALYPFYDAHAKYEAKLFSHEPDEWDSYIITARAVQRTRYAHSIGITHALESEIYAHAMGKASYHMVHARPELKGRLEVLVGVQEMSEGMDYNPRVIEYMAQGHAPLICYKGGVYLHFASIVLTYPTTQRTFKCQGSTDVEFLFPLVSGTDLEIPLSFPVLAACMLVWCDAPRVGDAYRANLRQLHLHASIPDFQMLLGAIREAAHPGAYSGEPIWRNPPPLLYGLLLHTPASVQGLTPSERGVFHPMGPTQTFESIMGVPRYTDTVVFMEDVRLKGFCRHFEVAYSLNGSASIMILLPAESDGRYFTGEIGDQLMHMENETLWAEVTHTLMFRDIVETTPLSREG